jgi:hypothetical protein
MFTVKAINADGSEFAMECASYNIEPLEPLRTSGEKRFAFKTFDTPFAQDEYSMLWTGRRCANWPGANAIYVMNRFGSTVASVFYEDEDDDAPLFGEEHAAEAA